MQEGNLRSNEKCLCITEINGEMWIHGCDSLDGLKESSHASGLIINDWSSWGGKRLDLLWCSCGKPPTAAGPWCVMILPVLSTDPTQCDKVRISHLSPRGIHVRKCMLLYVGWSLIPTTLLSVGCQPGIDLCTRLISSFFGGGEGSIAETRCQHKDNHMHSYTSLSLCL